MKFQVTLALGPLQAYGSAEVLPESCWTSPRTCNRSRWIGQSLGEKRRPTVKWDSPTAVSGDVGFRTCAGMWGCWRYPWVTMGIAQNVQLLLLNQTIFRHNISSAENSMWHWKSHVTSPVLEMSRDTKKVMWHFQRWKCHVTLKKSGDISSAGNVTWHLQHWKHHVTLE